MSIISITIMESTMIAYWCQLIFMFNILSRRIQMWQWPKFHDSHVDTIEKSNKNKEKKICWMQMIIPLDIKNVEMQCDSVVWLWVCVLPWMESLLNSDNMCTWSHQLTKQNKKKKAQNPKHSKKLIFFPSWKAAQLLQTMKLLPQLAVFKKGAANGCDLGRIYINNWKS